MPQDFTDNQNYFNIGNAFGNITLDDESTILAWLCPQEPRVRHRDIGVQRVDSIGAWILETPEFKSWRNGSRGDEANHPILFCHGNPGTGKSYISSLVIDRLCQEAIEGDTTVACFYFDFASRNEQSPVNMLGSLLRQLLSGLEEIPEAVVRSFRNQGKAIGDRELQVSGILKMFRTIPTTKRTFICVDALDECMPEHRTLILESLGQIVRESFDTRIFLTARSHVRSEVERKLDRGVTCVLIEPTSDGIIGYLREKLKNDTTPEIMTSLLEANIMEGIPKISSETFLLASLHIDAILRETSIARRGEMLKTVDAGVGLRGTYGATLERIMAQDKEKTKLAIAALTWICHAERPLQVDELRHALAVEIGLMDFDSENAPSRGALLDCCQGLITVDKEASTVRLIHFTAQEYLCAQSSLFNQPHSVIAEVCLTYLSSQQVKNLSSHPLLYYRSMPFLEYSSRYWGTHLRREVSGHTMALALDLLNNYEEHVSAVLLLRQVLYPSHLGGVGVSPLFSGLHCASFFGIVELVASLITPQSCDINKGDCGGYTPLLWAAKNGHEGVVKLLLERGDVKPDKLDNHDCSPLLWAANNGHERAVKLLLERGGVEPNRLDDGGGTPLFWAADSGHQRVVKLLLGRKDVDPNRPRRKNDRTPLLAAAIMGHEGVVKLLLQREDVEPDRLDRRGGTPLFWAANYGSEAVVKLLLGRKDVDPNRPRKENERTPLSAAAFKGHEGVIKLLLDREDVNPNRLDEDGCTPLFWAAHFGNEGVVKLLLSREDVDPNRPRKENKRTPLRAAACKGHTRVVKLLLEREDVEPDSLDDEGGAPLFWAANSGHEGVVKLLLARGGVDPNRPKKGNNRTPLWAAALNGHEGVIKILLEREDVEPNRQGPQGGTPLFWAANYGNEWVVKLLLSRKDVDPNLPRMGTNRTPLRVAAYKGYKRVVKLLLEREDVKPDKLDDDRCTPLFWAAHFGHDGVVKLLLDSKNVDPNHPRKGNNRTPLWAAAVAGHEEVVKILLEREDVEPNRPGMNGLTPLECAVANGHEGVIKLLNARMSVESVDAHSSH